MGRPPRLRAFTCFEWTMSKFSIFISLILLIALPSLAKTVCPHCGAMFVGTQATCEYDSTQLRKWLEMVDIPGGLFEIGSDDETLPADERPEHSILLDGFKVSAAEVTVAQYTAFLNDKQPYVNERQEWITLKGEAANWGSGHDSHICVSGGVYRFDEGWADYPVTYVSWEGATAFCEHYFLRLPTEAEWEYAATGPGRYAYPHSQTYNPLDYCSLDNPGDGEPPLKPVGSFPANGYGLYDMAGNAAEWCSDYYGEDYYAVSPDKNPAGPNRGISRVIRGGSWGDGRSGLRCRARTGEMPEVLDSRVGFRAAAD